MKKKEFVGNESSNKPESSTKEISLFFPAYNEEENIEEAVWNAKKILTRLAKDYEIIIVNDGSQDNTAEIAEKLAQKDEKIKVVHHIVNSGFGVALKTGITACTKELIFYTDADNQFNLEELEKFLPLIKDYDLVIGFRAQRKDPALRLFLAKAYNFIIRLVFKIQIRDVDCSFKLFRKEIFKDLPIRAKTGFADAEILIRAVKRGFTFKEMAVSHFPRRKGTVSFEILRAGPLALVKPKAIWDIVVEMIKLYSDLKW